MFTRWTWSNGTGRSSETKTTPTHDSSCADLCWTARPRPATGCRPWSGVWIWPDCGGRREGSARGLCAAREYPAIVTREQACASHRTPGCFGGEGCGIRILTVPAVVSVLVVAAMSAGVLLGLKLTIIDGMRSRRGEARLTAGLKAIDGGASARLSATTSTSSILTDVGCAQTSRRRRLGRCSEPFKIVARNLGILPA